MFATIVEAVQWHSQHGQAIHLPTPPACEQLLQRARADGIPVGTLYIVSRSLEAERSGNCDLATGDLWCVYDASRGEEGQREVVRTLLQLLARIQMHLPPPQTIAQDWAQVQRTIAQAAVLAQRWGQGTVFAAAEQQALSAQAARQEMLHHAAARLVGHRDPIVARQAYHALLAHWSRFHEQSAEQFRKALLETDQAVDRLVDMDRTPLRARWVATSTRCAREPASYGDLWVPPFPASARVLRAALARAMVTERCAEYDAPRQPVWYRSIREESDLVESILLLNSWFIDRLPQAAVRLRAWAYGDPSSMVCGAAHLYRLVVRYEDLPGQPASAHEAWWVFSGRHIIQQRALEGAWQRVLRSWLTWSELHCEDLATGLQTLWATLEHR